MRIVKATRLSSHDLSLLGWEAKRAYQRDQRDVSRWRGWRAPIGYQCRIPCTLQNHVIRAAAEEVLSRIAELCFDDALVLQSRVRSIEALPRREQITRDRHGRERIHLGRCRRDDRKILLNEDIVDSDWARYVFAHECGHAVQRIGHHWGHKANERWADRYALSLGYSRPASMGR